MLHSTPHLQNIFLKSFHFFPDLGFFADNNDFPEWILKHPTTLYHTLSHEYSQNTTQHYIAPSPMSILKTPHNIISHHVSGVFTNRLTTLYHTLSHEYSQNTSQHYIAPSPMSILKTPHNIISHHVSGVFTNRLTTLYHTLSQEYSQNTTQHYITPSH